MMEDTPTHSLNLHRFDLLVQEGRLKDARTLIERVVEARQMPASAIEYDQRFFQARLRRLAMPLFRRRHLDRLPGKMGHEDQGIAGVFRSSGALLKVLVNKRRHLHRSGEATTNPELAMESLHGIRGDINKLIVFSLATRRLKGLASDEITLLPSRRDEDEGVIVDNLRTSFDFHVHHRATGLEIPLQVRGRARQDEDYSPDIAVVSVSELASTDDNPRAIHVLTDALIADAKGSATADQVKHIEESTKRLEVILFTKLVETSEQQKTAEAV